MDHPARHWTGIEPSRHQACYAANTTTSGGPVQHPTRTSNAPGRRTEFFVGRWGHHRVAVLDGSRAALGPGVGVRMLHRVGVFGAFGGGLTFWRGEIGWLACYGTKNGGEALF